RIRVALEDSLKKIAVEEIKKKTEDSLKVEMEKIKKKSEDSLNLELQKNPVNAADSLKTNEAPKKEMPAAPDSLRKEEGAIPPQANLLFQLKENKEKFFLREDRRRLLFFRTSSTFSI
ncbi:MAG: hypothetical protein WC727_03940, partial [Ignavibacteriaceae bacterium]